MKLKWNKTVRGEATSTCGRYAVWLQARLLHGDREYGARFNIKGANGGGDWLTATAGSLTEAKEVCQLHLEGKWKTMRERGNR